MLKVLFTRIFHVETDEDLESHLDEVMEALLELEGERLGDSDISALLTENHVEISVVASSDLDDESQALGDAVSFADSAIRAAIHKAGGHTPEWVPVSVNMEALQPA